MAANTKPATVNAAAIRTILKGTGLQAAEFHPQTFRLVQPGYCATTVAERGKGRGQRPVVITLQGMGVGADLKARLDQAQAALTARGYAVTAYSGDADRWHWLEVRLPDPAN